MTEPTTSPPTMRYTIAANCTTCGKEVYSIVTVDEQEAKDGFAKALTAFK